MTPSRAQENEAIFSRLWQRLFEPDQPNLGRVCMTNERRASLIQAERERDSHLSVE